MIRRKRNNHQHGFDCGFVAGGGGIAYTSAKHAIVGFTKQLALDYAGQGIRVKGIAPGAIQTPMNAADFEGKVRWLSGSQMKHQSSDGHSRKK